MYNKEYIELIDEIHGFRRESNRLGISKHIDLNQLNILSFFYAFIKLLLTFCVVINYLDDARCLFVKTTYWDIKSKDS